jgi:hypothetical protein
MPIKLLFQKAAEDKRFVLSFGALTILAVGLRVALIAASDMRSIISYVPDDSFYYFQLASNFIKGLPSSVDGIHLTNGYHPLWVWNIGPIMLLKDIDPTLAVKAVLIYASLLSVGTAVAIYFIVREIGGPRWVGLFAYAVYLFTPSIALEDASGEPSGLSNLLITLSALVLIRIAKGADFGRLRAAGFGALLGLVVLARTENILFALVFLILLYLWSRRKECVNVWITAAAGLLLIAPWVIWNMAVFGTVIQVSAVACPYLERTNLLQESNLLSFIYRGALNGIQGVVTLFRFLPGKIFLPILLGMLFVVFHRRYKEMEVERKAVGLFLALFGTTAVLYFLHACIGLYVRNWHTASAAPFTVIIVASVLVIYADRTLINRIIRASFIALYIAGLLIYYVFFSSFALYGWQKENIKAIDWVKESPRLSTAMYDAGIVSYYTNGAVLPIDGNVNVEVQKAVEEMRVYDYMIENDVEYLIGWSWIFKKYRNFWPYPYEELFVDETPNDITPIKHKNLGEFRYYRLNR